jgi:hypothetical protein
MGCSVTYRVSSCLSCRPSQNPIRHHPGLHSALFQPLKIPVDPDIHGCDPEQQRLFRVRLKGHSEPVEPPCSKEARAAFTHRGVDAGLQVLRACRADYGFLAALWARSLPFCNILCVVLARTTGMEQPTRGSGHVGRARGSRWQLRGGL